MPPSTPCWPVQDGIPGIARNKFEADDIIMPLYYTMNVTIYQFRYRKTVRDRNTKTNLLDYWSIQFHPANQDEDTELIED